MVNLVINTVNLVINTVNLVINTVFESNLDLAIHRSVFDHLLHLVLIKQPFPDGKAGT